MFQGRQEKAGVKIETSKSKTRPSYTAFILFKKRGEKLIFQGQAFLQFLLFKNYT